MLKKLSLILLSFGLLALPAFAQTEGDLAPPIQNLENQAVEKAAEVEIAKTPVSVFMHPGCAFCRKEIVFLAELKTKRDDFETIYYNIDNPSERALYERFTVLEGIPQVTPITLVGNTVLQGFGGEGTTGQQIVELLDLSAGSQTYRVEEFLAKGGSTKVESCSAATSECAAARDKFLVDVPFFGVIDVAKYSLPTMSVILGFIDGFNPCAMWVLVTFLVVLVQIGDRRKMWEIAGLFILAEAIMYYLILNVWFTAWDFVGMDRLVTPIVGLIAVGGGVFFLYEGITSDGTCKVTNPEQRQKIHFRIKDLAAKPLTWITALGVLGLAFSVNIIEFACSIGIPQAFTKILEINALSTFREQLMILIYTFFYMVDDFIVFGIALAGIQYLGVTQKYSKYSNILGGVLMLLLGGLLIFAPDLLKFV